MNPKNIKPTHNGLTRIKIYTIEEVFDWIKHNPKKRMIWSDNDNIIKISLKNAKVFYEKGITYVNCGVKGLFCALEKEGRGYGYHLDLYGKNEKGEVMLTI